MHQAEFIMMRSFAVVLLLVGLAVSEPSVQAPDYVGSQVLTVTPTEESHINYLNGLYRSDLYDFWKPTGRVGKDVDIMATRWMLPVLKKTLEVIGVEYTVKIADLNKLIVVSTSINDARRSAAAIEGKSMEWTAYHTYDEINAWVDTLAADYPDIVTVTDVGSSYEGRVMKKLVVSTGGADKPIIFVDGGIHAREWIASATVTFMMNELITNSSAYQDSLDAVDFIFMPAINPDGYSYSMDTDRMWRKTRSVNEGQSESCYGVDPNRNWDFHYGESGTSTRPCSDIYKGEEAFSEIETRVVRDEILKAGENGKGIVYLTFHSALEQVLRPFGYDLNVPADNNEEATVLCNSAIAALYKVHNILYDCILSGELYAAAGASDDYAKGVAGFTYVYTFELRDQGYGFVLPAEQIIPSGEETFEAFRVIFEHVRDNPSG